MLANNIKFTKPKWYMKLPFMKPQNPSINDLRPTFIGYISVMKFYHREYHTKPGHYIITPNGIGEIIEIIAPEKRDSNEYQYHVKLLDNVTAFYEEHQLKYLVVNPIEFYERNLPILLSFSDYLYANPSGITDGQYTFKLTSHGYATMTDKTRDYLEINKLLSKYKGGRNLLKVMRKHNYIIIKKEKSCQKKLKSHLTLFKRL